LHNIGVVTVADVARANPRIYAALDNRQADHQATVVEVGGKIAMQHVSILIDPRSSHSYIHPKIVGSCSLEKSNHGKSWLVQLATGIKGKVSEVVKKCPLMLNGLPSQAGLNVLPLGSYDILIGMDWLEVHQAKLDCYNKILECIDDESKPQLVK